ATNKARTTDRLRRVLKISSYKDMNLAPILSDKHSGSLCSRRKESPSEGEEEPSAAGAEAERRDQASGRADRRAARRCAKGADPGAQPERRKKMPPPKEEGADQSRPLWRRGRAGRPCVKG